MKQYCRYCIYAIESCDCYVVWCDKKKKEMSFASAKSVNNCKDFSFCEIDCFNLEKKYKPREKREKQPQLF